MNSSNSVGTPRRTRFTSLGRWGFVAVLVAISIAAAPLLIGPPCPKQIVIGTGSPSGAYFAFASRYREILARDGIDLQVQSTAGSVENVSLLCSETGDVSLAMVQGGIASGESADELTSLASLYLEPIWVFYRGYRELDRLTQLSGQRIAVGVEGSGTRAVALALLEENDVGEDARSDSATTFKPLGGTDAAEALKNGEIDAAFFVISSGSAIVRELLEADGIQLMSFRRARAYERKFPYLTSVTLSEGMLDLQKNVPLRDTVLLAPTATLVARKDLHPALIPLLLRAATEVHESGGLLEEPGAFPSPRYVDAPLSADARRYFESGPSFFYRHLPFHVAAWLNRVKLLLLPLCTLLLPLVKCAPPVYRWRIRSKIYRWYRVLRDIDQRLKNTQQTGSDFSNDIARLHRLQHELSEVSVPLSYMEEFYNLRIHVAFVLDRLNEAMQTRVQPAKAA